MTEKVDVMSHQHLHTCPICDGVGVVRDDYPDYALKAEKERLEAENARLRHSLKEARDATENCFFGVPPGDCYKAESIAQRAKAEQYRKALDNGRPVLLPVNQSTGAVDYYMLERGYSTMEETAEFNLMEGWRWEWFVVAKMPRDALGEEKRDD